MLTGVNLPDEIIPEILTRLPAKSLGRFKSVSKPWKTLISDPKFIKTHLFFHNSRRRCKILYLSHKRQSLTVLDFNCKSFFPSKPDFRIESHKWLRFYGSCNGLALALNLRHELCLFNPTTKECKTLPKPSHINLVCGRFTCGFGYDSSTDDYKVVVISESKIVNVYRLNCNRWYTVKYPVYDKSSNLWLSFPVVSANGFLNWFSSYSSLSLPITAFDLAEEKFCEVPLPPVFGICSDVVSWFKTDIFDRTELLILKEYGVYECKVTINLKVHSLGIRPLIVLNDNEFMVEIHGKKVVYNANGNTSREIVIHDFSLGKDYQCSFGESLVSLEQFH